MTFTFSWIFNIILPQPPQLIRPKIGTNSVPSQIRKNCTTSLNTAEISPPSVTYMATVSEETRMLQFMFQPSSKFRIFAMANMLDPLTNRSSRRR